MHRSVVARGACDGVVDVEGQREGIQENASDNSSGGWTMEKQSFGSSMGPLVRTALGAEKVEGANPEGCEGYLDMVSRSLGPCITGLGPYGHEKEAAESIGNTRGNAMGKQRSCEGLGDMVRRAHEDCAAEKYESQDLAALAQYGAINGLHQVV
jgi:hypothetical protein